MSSVFSVAKKGIDYKFGDLRSKTKNEERRTIMLLDLGPGTWDLGPGTKKNQPLITELLAYKCLFSFYLLFYSLQVKQNNLIY